eukprot:16259059-Heterocapsa_arctica.AAC.1
MDRMHSKGHTDPWCRANCHPETAENTPLVAGMNTSVCEQTFSKTNRYGPMVMHMRRWTCVLFLHEIIAARNGNR